MPASSPFPSPLAEAAPLRISYARMRLRWCRGALADLLRRWAVYLVVGVLVLGSSANGAIAAMSGLAAWSVFPVLRATTHPPATLIAVALLHSLAGAVAVWGLRPVLWSRTWLEAEAALPIDPRDRLRSDIVVAGFALAPLFCAYAAGVLVWRAQSPPWMHGEWAAATAALALSIGSSLLWGVLIIRRMRHRPRSLGRAAPRSSPAEVQRLTLVGALVIAPLRRGPARRSARLIALGLGALCSIAAAAWRWPEWAAWWLAAFAAASLVFSTRLNVLITGELAPLHQHANCLPVSQRSLLVARRIVAILPQAAAQLVLLAVLASIGRKPRLAVLVAFMLALFIGSLVQIVSTTRAEGHRATDPAHRVSTWLFSLVLGVVLATEVFP